MYGMYGYPHKNPSLCWPVLGKHRWVLYQLLSSKRVQCKVVSCPNATLSDFGAVYYGYLYY